MDLKLHNWNSRLLDAINIGESRSGLYCLDKILEKVVFTHVTREQTNSINIGGRKMYSQHVRSKYKYFDLMLTCILLLLPNTGGPLLRSIFYQFDCLLPLLLIL